MGWIATEAISRAPHRDRPFDVGDAGAALAFAAFLSLLDVCARARGSPANRGRPRLRPLDLPRSPVSCRPRPVVGSERARRADGHAACCDPTGHPAAWPLPQPPESP